MRLKKERERTYKSWLDGGFQSEQKEYTKPVKLLDDDGTLHAPGWARRMLFEYEREKAVPFYRLKEWEFYQVNNGRYCVQVNIAKIAIGGMVSTVLIDLTRPDKNKRPGGVIVESTVIFTGNKHWTLPANGDAPGGVKFSAKGIGRADFEIDTQKNNRSLYYRSTAKGKDVVSRFQMDIPDGHENITTVLPFAGKPTRFFMTMKQNCMPCSGTFTFGGEVYEFSKDDSFCCVDWGRVNAPHRLVWYWGNGSTYIHDKDGNKHIFGIEITWGIGDESAATETCLFYDGKAHKIGAVDVEVFPKPDKYMNPWRFLSQDGRFDMTMTPVYDHHTDLNLLVLRMNCHQVHGRWNGTVILDDGTKLEIRDMAAFCEYCENKW